MFCSEGYPCVLMCPMCCHSRAGKFLSSYVFHILFVRASASSSLDRSFYPASPLIHFQVNRTRPPSVVCLCEGRRGGAASRIGSIGDEGWWPGYFGSKVEKNPLEVPMYLFCPFLYNQALVPLFALVPIRYSNDSPQQMRFLYFGTI